MKPIIVQCGEGVKRMAYYDIKNLEGFFGNLAPPRRWKKGNTLFVQGQKVDAVYFVDSGKVKAETYAEVEGTLVLYYAIRGMAIAEEHVFLENYGYSPIVEEDAELRYLKKSVFQQRLTERPEYANMFMECLSSRYSDLRVLCNLLTIRRADDRILSYLKWRAIKDGPVIDLQGRIGLQGEMLGLTKESVYRAIARLEKKGAISRENGKVTLL